VSRLGRIEEEDFYDESPAGIFSLPLNRGESNENTEKFLRHGTSPTGRAPNTNLPRNEEEEEEEDASGRLSLPT
jgi:hypothetical protein